MKINKVHCLFEQSGTFKNEFIKLGIPAEDYDIQNVFGETDFVVDLYKEIKGGYNNEPSIFDNIGQQDLVIAFFPCVRFENQILIWFRGEAPQQLKQSEEQRLEKDIELHNELHENYSVVSMLAIICLRKHIRLIIENPYSSQHYLQKYWCMKPAIIDTDRTERGDYYPKPTQYWFIGCNAEQNLIFEPLDYVEKTGIVNLWGTNPEDVIARSAIHPQYANRFIREFILDDNA